MKPIVVIQGAGFVGAAMAVACARAGTRSGGEPIYEVFCVDLPTPTGLSRIKMINRGEFPFVTTDKRLITEMRLAFEANNLHATTDTDIFQFATIVIVDVQFDITDLTGNTNLEFSSFIKAVNTIGKLVQPETLVMVETTIPPGTCKSVIRPTLDGCAEDRGLPKNSFLLAHSYERVMPGQNYLASITDYWRVFAGDTLEAANACESFLSTVINVKDFPLTRLSNTTASETAKVLENSYRAVNIAFMDEWGRFAEKVGIDMFEIVNAIRLRPTHNNIMQPGFGVGGYCLTKDPLFAGMSARDLFSISDIDFPFSRLSVSVNREMPLHPLTKVRDALDGLGNKRILLAGISYRADVSDTRYSPSQIFYERAVVEQAEVLCYDPLVRYWPELHLETLSNLYKCPEVDAVVFAVPHREFDDIQPADWLSGRCPYILDANNCLSASQRLSFELQGCRVDSIGRGNSFDHQ